jgi:hypothetical protein
VLRAGLFLADIVRPAAREQKIAIRQSNCGPRKGYFDRINSIVEFVLHDDI